MINRNCSTQILPYLEMTSWYAEDISIPKFVKHFRNIDVRGVECRGSGVFDTRKRELRVLI